MNEDTASQLLESIEQMAPGVTLESAAQTVMAEALKACSSLEQLTQLPVTPTNVKQFGNDFIANVGGAIHGHPMGTLAGARAMRQAIDKQHNIEYEQAIAKWGFVK